MKPSLNELGFRVKLYLLSSSGDWEDSGTGHLSLKENKITEELSEFYFHIINEKDRGKNVLYTKIVTDDIYELQGDSLIVWNDKIKQRDYAISFQESKHCKKTWNKLRKCQGRKEDGAERIEKNIKKIEEEDDDEDYEEVFGSNSTITLPKVNLKVSVLNQILLTIQNCGIVNKSKIAKLLMKDGASYLKSLYKCFSDLELIKDHEALGVLCKIFTRIILLNDAEVLNHIFSIKNIINTIGILEYDMDVSSKKQDHRKFLLNGVQFVSVLNISSKKRLTDQIKRAFYLKYVKETVIPRTLDDATFTTIQGMLYVANYDIISRIVDDHEFLVNLYTAMYNTETSEKVIINLSKFLNELIMMIKGISHQAVRDKILNQTMENGKRKSFYMAIFRCLRYKKSKIVRQNSASTLLSLVTMDCSLVKKEICNNKQFLRVLILSVVNETEMCVSESGCEILKILLSEDESNFDSFFDIKSILEIQRDGDGSKGVALKNKFLDLFYSPSQEFLKLLTRPIFEFKKELLNNVDYDNRSLVMTVDLMSFLVQEHGYRSKNYFIAPQNFALINKLGQILREHTAPVKLVIIRFLYNIIKLKNRFYANWLTKVNIFDSLFYVWKEVHKSNNMVNSCIIHLLDAMIKTESIKLITYIGDKYLSILKESIEIDSIMNFLSKYNKIKFGDEEELQKKRKSDRGLFNERRIEEDYFSEKNNSPKKKKRESEEWNNDETSKTNGEENSDDKTVLGKRKVTEIYDENNKTTVENAEKIQKTE